jgi:hypothetical protein
MTAPQAASRNLTRARVGIDQLVGGFHCAGRCSRQLCRSGLSAVHRAAARLVYDRSGLVLDYPGIAVRAG